MGTARLSSRYKNAFYIVMGPIFYPTKNRNNFSKLFWTFLFLPDVIVKLITFYSADYKEYIISNYIIYYFLYGLVIISCIYFPLIYVIVWKKAHSYREEVNWGVLAKIYIVLSLSISNFSFMVIGGGRLFQ